MKKIKAVLCMLLAFCVCAPYAQTQRVSAGKTGVQIEDGSIFEKTDDEVYADWKFTRNQGVSVVNSVVNFSATSDVGNPLFSRTPAKLSKDVEDGLIANFTLDLKEIVGIKQFGLVFGLARLDRDVGESGSSYVYFTKADGVYKYGAVYYGEAQTQIIAETALPSGANANELEVEVTITATGKLKLSLDGVRVYESATENEVQGEGYIGFAQNGTFTDAGNYIDVDIKELTILNEYYARPQTPEITRATFENSEFNTQEWYLASTRCGGNGLIVGDNKLKFDGSGQNTYFATRHKYSNFELEYDISNVRNYATVDANGWVTSASQWHGLEFGRDGNDVKACASLGNMKSSYFVYFDAPKDSSTGERTGKTSVRLVDHGSYAPPSVTLPDKYGFFNKDFEGVVRVKYSVRDGELNIYMRLVNEYEWTRVYNYQFAGGYTPVGFVGLRGEGNQYVEGRTMTSGSFYDIDEIAITNYDALPTLVEIGFTSNVLPKWEDYKYVDTWTDDYLISHTKGKGTK